MRLLAVCPEEDLMAPSLDPPLLQEQNDTSSITRSFNCSQRPRFPRKTTHLLLREEREDQCALVEQQEHQERASFTLKRSLSEDDYLRNAVPWESLEQRAYVDTLLERRAHYKSLRFLGAVALVVVALVGWAGWVLEEQPHFLYGDNYAAANENHEFATTTTTMGHTVSHIARWIILGALCMAPLYVSCEGRTQEELVDKEIRSMAKKRMLLIPPRNPKSSPVQQHQS
jgi:hypothetical protein